MLARSMSGIVSGIDYTVLFPASSSSDGSSLLSTLYASSGSSTSGGNPLVALQLAEINQTKDVAATAKQPQVANDIATFTAALAKAKTPADLLANPTALKVLLTANGLGDQAAYPAFAQKVLLSDPSSSKSLVSQLDDSTWTSVVKTFAFATTGLDTLRKAGVAAIVTDGYAEVSWRESLDAATPGLSSALSFKAQAASVSSVDDILGNAVLRDVVTTALGIPEQIAFQPIEAQEKAITSRLDIGKLQDAHFVTNLTDQYLLAKQSSSTTTGSSSLEQLAGQVGLVV